MPYSTSASLSIAVSVPSRLAPRRTVWCVARPAAAVELLAVPVVHEPHGTAGALRELDGHAGPRSRRSACRRSRRRCTRRSRGRAPSARSKRRGSSSRASKMPCVDDPAGQLVAASTTRRRRAARAASAAAPGVSTWSSTRDVGGGQRRVDVAAGRPRTGRRRCAGRGRPPRCRRRTAADRSRAPARATPRRGGRGRVGRDDGDRRAGVVGLGCTAARSAWREAQLGLGAEHGAHAGHGERRVESQRLHPRRARRASAARRRGACRAARRRPCSGPRRETRCGPFWRGVGLPTTRQLGLGLPGRRAVLLDEDPLLLEAALHLGDGLDEARHQASPPRGARIACSIFT